jgi:hypothetical protein
MSRMKLTLAAALLIAASAANAETAIHVTTGPIAFLHREKGLGDGQSTVAAVTNESGKSFHMLHVECGFFSGDKLVGAGSWFATDVEAGQTAYVTVQDQAGILGGGIVQRADKAECRAHGSDH